MTTSAPERLVTNSNRKLLSSKTGPICVVEGRTTILTIEEDGICHTDSGDMATVASAAKDNTTEDNKMQTHQPHAEEE